MTVLWEFKLTVLLQLSVSAKSQYMVGLNKLPAKISINCFVPCCSLYCSSTPSGPKMLQPLGFNEVCYIRQSTVSLQVVSDAALMLVKLRNEQNCSMVVVK